MKKMKKGSKGFTLTELAIVIAVIAILIAVLVPTFVSLINKAEESSDVVTVRNMNTVLSTETDDIDKPTDALKIVYEEGGYSVANMTPKSTGKIVYDELTSSFVFVYSDGTTYPEDTTTKLTAYTTWELVSTSDIEPDDNGEYHFEESDYANNSIILKGSDWAGKTVYAKYGVELWNDNDTSTTLSGLYIKNTDTEVQNVVAEAGSISLAKSAIKTAGSADSTRNIIVNVKTNYLSYAADVYNISDHSTVNTLLSTGGKGTYYQYGTTNGYDITKSGSSNVVVCNEKQAEKINNKEVAVIKTADTQTSIVITDNTDTITIDMDSKENVTTIVVTLEESETVQVTITEEGTVTITAGDTEITVDSETSLSEAATNSGFGTADFPYLVSTYADLVEKVKSDCYIQLEGSISCDDTITIDTNITLELNGKTISYAGTAITIGENASLTIIDSVGEGVITSTASAGSKNAKVYAVNNAGTLILKSGTITVSQKYHYSIYNTGTLEISGGNVTSTATGTSFSYCIYNESGTVNIYGGTINSVYYCIDNEADSTLIVKDVEISGKLGIVNVGDLTVNSGSNITGTSYYGINNKGTVTINGGNISGSCTTAFQGGLDDSKGSGISNNGGTLTVNGGNISGKWFGIYNNGTLEVTGGTITGNTIGILAKATTVKIGKLGADDKNITIKGATSAYADTANSSGYESAIYVRTGATVEIYSGTINGLRGVVVIGTSSNVSTLNIYGGKIDTTEFAVCNNGTRGSDYATINISGGTITSTSAPAIYLPAAYGTTTISGGTIKGATGVEVRGGSLTISGGTFEATAESFSESYNNSGSTIIGAALAISTYNLYADLTVSVENCELKGIYAIYECYVNGKYDSSNNLLETPTALEYAVTVTVANITSTGEIYSQNTSIDD